MARQIRRSGAGAVATPTSSRRPFLRPASRTDITRQGRGIRQFLSEVRTELRRVVWPTREQGARLTALVVGISVAMGILLGFMDYAFAELFRAILQQR
jgi:preprotein translocase subunit SecE